MTARTPEEIARGAAKAFMDDRFYLGPAARDTEELLAVHITGCIKADRVSDERVKAAVLAEREACAGEIESYAAESEAHAQFEDTPEMKAQALLYAKHVRRSARAIRARPAP
jgi:hypothetical protein